jgi:hypothetical protein
MNTKTPKSYRVTKEINPGNSCSSRVIPVGSILYKYPFFTYGCISPEGVAVTEVPATEQGKPPFFEVPETHVELTVVNGKKYIGKRLDFTGVCEVFVEEDGEQRPLPPRNDIVNHSPDGFEWGYGGSGPAQLAFAILADYLGPQPSPLACPWCGVEMKDWKCQADSEACGFDGSKSHEMWGHILGNRHSYQLFKADHVASFPKAGFVLTSDEIEKWLKHTRRG